MLGLHIMVDILVLLSPTIVAFLYLLLRLRRQRSVGLMPLAIVVVDGSNVMFWRDNTPRIGTLIVVVRALQAQGLRPVVWFDANAGFHLIGRYAHDGELARALGLSARQVVVVPKGTPADPLLLAGARDLKAAVVSNDRFRDWQANFGDVLAGQMIRGRMDGNGVVLDGLVPVELTAAA
jgi:hypothetical protein